MYKYITVYSCTYIWYPGYNVLKMRTQYMYVVDQNKSLKKYSKDQHVVVEIYHLLCSY